MAPVRASAPARRKLMGALASSGLAHVFCGPGLCFRAVHCHPRTEPGQTQPCRRRSAGVSEIRVAPAAHGTTARLVRHLLTARGRPNGSAERGFEVRRNPCRVVCIAAHVLTRCSYAVQGMARRVIITCPGQRTPGRIPVAGRGVAPGCARPPPATVPANYAGDDIAVREYGARPWRERRRTPDARRWWCPA